MHFLPAQGILKEISTVGPSNLSACEGDGKMHISGVI